MRLNQYKTKILITIFLLLVICISSMSINTLAENFPSPVKTNKIISKNQMDKKTQYISGSNTSLLGVKEIIENISNGNEIYESFLIDIDYVTIFFHDSHHQCDNYITIIFNVNSEAEENIEILEQILDNYSNNDSILWDLPYILCDVECYSFARVFFTISKGRYFRDINTPSKIGVDNIKNLSPSTNFQILKVPLLPNPITAHLHLMTTEALRLPYLLLNPYSIGQWDRGPPPPESIDYKNVLFSFFNVLCYTIIIIVLFSCICYFSYQRELSGDFVHLMKSRIECKKNLKNEIWIGCQGCLTPLWACFCDFERGILRGYQRYQDTCACGRSDFLKENGVTPIEIIKAFQILNSLDFSDSVINIDKLYSDWRRKKWRGGNQT